jgi:hypothetical protein
MTLKHPARLSPGVRRLSLLRQRLTFDGSLPYWEARYSHGGTSGVGSYGELARGKATFLNTFVRDRGVSSVIEFGSGDGNQLSLAEYPKYVGLDVSRTAIGMCKALFAEDRSKSFFLYDGECFVDRANLLHADLALSLDVVYHLVEDAVFETYMSHLFMAALRYVIIYSTNTEIKNSAPHVKHRNFSRWVEGNCRQWRLLQVAPGPNPDCPRPDFFIYARLVNGDR